MAKLTVVFIVVVIATTVLAQRRRTRPGGVPPTGLTTEYVWSRVRSLERKLSQTQRDLANAKVLIKNLEGRVGAMSSAGSTGGGGGQRARLADLRECPIRAEGFYYVPQFRTCYRLEAKDLLVNQTEAQRVCQSHSTKAHLVSIESEREQEWLAQTWLTERGIGSLVRYWTSGRRSGDQWKWEATNLPYRYTNWIPTSTHDDDRYSCMAIYSNEAFYWGDVACWAPHLVTCEIRL